MKEEISFDGREPRGGSRMKVLEQMRRKEKNILETEKKVLHPLTLSFLSFLFH